MEKAMITLDIPLDIIHFLYKLAIKKNTIVDEVVEDILREYLDSHKDDAGIAQ